MATESNSAAATRVAALVVLCIADSIFETDSPQSLGLETAKLISVLWSWCQQTVMAGWLSEPEN